MASTVLPPTDTSGGGDDTAKWLGMHRDLLTVKPSDRGLLAAKQSRATYKALPQPLKILFWAVWAGILLIVVPICFAVVAKTMSNGVDANRISMLGIIAVVLLLAWIFVLYKRTRPDACRVSQT